MQHLITYIRRLLQCAELSQDSLEPETVTLIKEGNTLLKAWEKETRHAGKH